LQLAGHIKVLGGPDIARPALEYEKNYLLCMYVKETVMRRKNAKF
jgi:hypothetical protein